MSLEVLGGCEYNFSANCHKGADEERFVGNIPIVILLGDDHQLPSVQVGGKGKGAPAVFTPEGTIWSNKIKNAVEMNGAKSFKRLASNVVALKENKRSKTSDSVLRDICCNMRNNDSVTEQQANFLQTLHLDNENISKEWRSEETIKQCIAVRTLLPLLSFTVDGSINIAVDHRYIVKDFDMDEDGQATGILSRLSVKPFSIVRQLKQDIISAFPAKHSVKFSLPKFEEILAANTDAKMIMLADSPEHENEKEEVKTFIAIPPFLLDFLISNDAYDAKSMLEATIHIFRASQITHTSADTIRKFPNHHAKEITKFLFLTLKIDHDDGELIPIKTQDDFSPTTKKLDNSKLVSKNKVIPQQ